MNARLERLKEAMNNLKVAFDAVDNVLSEAVEYSPEDDFSDEFADGYPFKESFDEVSFAVEMWVNDFCDAIIEEK